MFFSSHIIAILAAILFPVFAKAREKARQSSCLNNVKQITLGLVQYVQDYDERFPRGAGTDWGDAGAADPGYPHGGYVDGIFPYVKNVQVFMCPSDSLRNCLSAANVGGAHEFRSDYLPGTYPNQQLSYGYNYNMGAQSLGAVQYPAETALLIEAIERPYFYQYGALPNGGLGIAGGSAGVDPQRMDNRHNEGMNIGFIDGHAKWLNKQNVTQTRSNL